MVCWLSFLFKKLCRRHTDRQTYRHTDIHTQISKNRPPHVNFCFRRRTKLYGALRAPIIQRETEYPRGYIVEGKREGILYIERG